MPSKRSKPTAAIQRTITSFIRAGGFAHVAAEAAGVPRERFEKWMVLGQEGKHKVFRDFYLAVLQAQAQARLGAEVKALTEKPMDWLKSGPGRETAANPGWTAPARARQAHNDQNLDLLAHPQMQKVCKALLDLLIPFPEARSAVSQALATAGVMEASGK